MNPLLKKEIRLLLPAWALTLLLAGVAAFIFQAHDEPRDVMDSFAPVWLGVMILCASSFGREFSLGTFSSLLAQPFPRRQYWLTKVGVLTAALVSVLAVYGLCTGPRLFAVMGWSDTAWLIVLLLTAIAGGLWMALLVRQMMAVIWLVALAPGLLCLPFLLVLSHFDAADQTVEVTLYALLLIYAVAGIAGSWLIFRRAQDTPWSGGTITLPEWMAAAVRLRAGTDERHRMPWQALIRKEFHFNQVLLLGMGGLFLLDLGEVGVRFARRQATGDFNQILQILGIVVWALVPLVIGCTSIAEERKLGTLEGQLCQPVSGRRQFIVKLGFTLICGGLLSSLFPVVTEILARLAGLKVDEPPAFAIGLMAAAMCAVAVVGLYASSLTRNVLQALPLAVGTIVGIFAVSDGFVRLSGFESWVPDFDLWSPFLPNIILAVLLPVAVVWLAWRNFGRLPETARIWRRNVLGLAGVIVFTMAASVLIYHRAWEKLTPFEPAHGPARWSMSQPPVTHRSDIGDSFVISLPDGRDWFGCMIEDFPFLIRHEMLRELLPTVAWPQFKAQFIPGSNWVSLTAGYLDFWAEKAVRTNGTESELDHVINSRETVGIRADGTLWVSDKPSGTNWNTSPLVQFGRDTDWWQVIGLQSPTSVLLLKKNGTLWRWGSAAASWEFVPTNWPGLRAQPPHQIGTNSDWQNLVQLGLPMAQKKDGSLWALDVRDKAKTDDFVQHANITAGFGKSAVNAQKLASGYGPFNAGIRTDGTLWIWGENLYNDRARWNKMAVLQSGHETNWLAVAVGPDTMTALKSDGTLWHWGGESGQYNSDYPDAGKYTAPPRRLGIHNDWVALTQTWWGITTLAADGSLWLWPEHSYYSASGIMLIEPARKPVLLGNVFAAN
jgi:ABC-type transport system involved in multi-copper enzyme maturation permease subunit